MHPFMSRKLLCLDFETIILFVCLYVWLMSYSSIKNFIIEKYNLSCIYRYITWGRAQALLRWSQWKFSLHCFCPDESKGNMVVIWRADQNRTNYGFLALFWLCLHASVVHGTSFICTSSSFVYPVSFAC